MSRKGRNLSSQTSALGRMRRGATDQVFGSISRLSRMCRIVADRINRSILSSFARHVATIRSMRLQTRNVFQFIRDQTVKTIRKPSRIPIIIVEYGKRWFARKVIAVLVKNKKLKTLPGFLASTELLSDAEALLSQNQPDRAWALFSKGLPYTKDPKKLFVAAACLIQGLGRKTEAFNILERGNELRSQRAAELGVPIGKYRVLADIWPNQLGHVAVVDYVIKQGILEGRSAEDTIIFAPPGKPPNLFFLEQWRPHCRFVTDPRDLPFPIEALEALAVDYLGPRQKDGTTAYFWDVAAKTYRRWHAEKRKPVLSLAADIHERGWSTLESVGVPRDAWFVNLHVREVTSKKHHAGLHNVLNAEIDDYIPAVKEITSRGGWVIRLGDPTMSKLPPMPKVIDYCHSNIRSDWMDVFLCVNARFLLGTSSGPAYIPALYGVPSVLTNWWPHGQRPWHPHDIFLPKLYKDHGSGRYLSLSESLSEPFGYCNSIEYLQKTSGIVVESNSPEDIRAATIEMLDRIAGTAQYDAEDLELRTLTETIHESKAAFGNAFYARAFIKQRKSFLS